MIDMKQLAQQVFDQIMSQDVYCSGCGKSLKDRLGKSSRYRRVIVHPSGRAFCTKTCMTECLVEGAVAITKYCPIGYRQLIIGASFTLEDMTKPKEGA
jgi:hypothetical protein